MRDGRQYGEQLLPHPALSRRERGFRMLIPRRRVGLQVQVRSAGPPYLGDSLSGDWITDLTVRCAGISWRPSELRKARSNSPSLTLPAKQEYAVDSRGRLNCIGDWRESGDSTMPPFQGSGGNRATYSRGSVRRGGLHPWLPNAAAPRLRSCDSDCIILARGREPENVYGGFFARGGIAYPGLKSWAKVRCPDGTGAAKQLFAYSRGHCSVSLVPSLAARTRSCNLTLPSPKGRGVSTPSFSARTESCSQLPESKGTPFLVRSASMRRSGSPGSRISVQPSMRGQSRTNDTGTRLRFGSVRAAEMLGVNDEHEYAVAVLIRRFFADADAAGESAGEDFDHQAEAKTFVGLVAAHREDRARRLAVERVGIVGRAAFAVEQPTRGQVWPAIFLTRTFPSAVALVPKSNRSGPPSAGTPMASGLVPRRGALPPGGATRRATPCVLTMTIETMPASAASSQYSPSRPMWLERISVPTATPFSWALSMSRSVSRPACTWPKPQLPSAVRSESVSRRTVNGAPVTTSPLPSWSRYYGIRMTPCESWPRRLAATSERPTSSASSRRTPPAARRSMAKRVRESGGITGMRWVQWSVVQGSVVGGVGDESAAARFHWRRASYMAMAAALERFKLRTAERMGIFRARSRCCSRIDAGSPFDSLPNTNTSPRANCTSV